MRLIRIFAISILLVCGARRALAQDGAHFPVLSLAEERFAVLAEQSPAGTVEVLVSAEPSSIAEPFLLENPPRLVIDIGITGAHINKSVETSGSALIQGLRIGSHAQMVRLVFDLTHDLPITFHAARTAGGMAVNIEPANAAAEPPVAEPAETPVASPVATAAPASPTAAPTSTARPDPTGTAAVTATPSASPTPQATITPTPTVTPSPSPEVTAEPPAEVTPLPTLPVVDSVQEIEPAETDDRFRLRAIAFGHAESGAPELRIELARRSEFTLSKEGERTYRLTIPGLGELPDHLLLPHYPPYDFEGLTLVQAHSERGDAIVRLGIERGVRLTAVMSGSSIIVRAARD